MSFNWKEALSHKIVYPVIIALVLGVIGFGFNHSKRVWAAPDKIVEVSDKVDTLTGVVNKVADLQEQTNQRIALVEQKQETSEKIQSMQVDALKEQIGILREMRKK